MQEDQIIKHSQTQNTSNVQDISNIHFIPNDFIDETNPLLHSKIIYRVDCQCLNEIETQLEELMNKFKFQSRTYYGVKCLDKNFSEFKLYNIVYKLNLRKINRNIRYLTIDKSILQEDVQMDQSQDDDKCNLPLRTAPRALKATLMGLKGHQVPGMQCPTCSMSDVRMDQSQDDIQMDDFQTPTEDSTVNITISDISNSSISTNTNISTTDDSEQLTMDLIINKPQFVEQHDTEQYKVERKILQGRSFKICVYSFYQNQYLIKCFVLFDHVALFRYFYKEPLLYDVFQSVVGHYGYLNSLELEKNRLYYFYKIDNLQDYILKIYVYQLNQGKWQSWNAETNIILGLDLSRPFYVIQFLQNIDNKHEKIFIDLLNKFDTNLENKTEFIQNIFSREFQYLTHTPIFGNEDQGILIDVQGFTRQIWW